MTPKLEQWLQKSTVLGTDKVVKITIELTGMISSAVELTTMDDLTFMCICALEVCVY